MGIAWTQILSEHKFEEQIFTFKKVLQIGAHSVSGYTHMDGLVIVQSQHIVLAQ